MDKRDLLRQRQFFEEAGYLDIVPPDENCVPMIDILFPLLFSGHHLVGQNHRALADAEQLQLIVILFEELCKPPNQRDLSLLP